MVNKQNEQRAETESAEQWSPDLASRLAMEEGIAKLAEAHWLVITALRRQYLVEHKLPVMKLVCHELDLVEGCVSKLFKNPAVAWRIAGLPEPGEEVRAYLETAEVTDRDKLE